MSNSNASFMKPIWNKITYNFPCKLRTLAGHICLQSQQPHINAHVSLLQHFNITSLSHRQNTVAALNSILLLAFIAAAPLIVNSGDPDILTDFVIPQNLTLPMIDGNFFTFTGMRSLMDDNAPELNSFTVLKASASEFPALTGQSVSFAVLLFPPESVNPPHTHPRSAEQLFLIDGMLDVGFVDTENKLYTQTLQPGDMFVFPKGLVHFQYCKGKGPAVAVSAFGSASAGTVSIPGTIFGTGIDDDVLAKSFKTDIATVQKVKAGLAPKA